MNAWVGGIINANSDKSSIVGCLTARSGKQFETAMQKRECAVVQLFS